MNSSVLISVCSLITSVFMAYFTIRVQYLKYFSKKERILLTVAESKVEDGKLKLSVIYSNIKYRQFIITSSFIQLSSKGNIGRFQQENNISEKNWITPVVLSGKEHTSLMLEYIFSDVMKNENIDITIRTYYINSKGENLLDDFHIGFLSKNDIGRVHICVENIEHQLSDMRRLGTVC